MGVPAVPVASHLLDSRLVEPKTVLDRVSTHGDQLARIRQGGVHATRAPAWCAAAVSYAMEPIG